MLYQGFIVQIQIDLSGNRVFVFGRLENGQSFGIVDEKWKPRVWVLEKDYEKALAVVPHGKTDSHMKSFALEDLRGLVINRLADFRSTVATLEQEGLRTWEGDRSLYQLWLRDYEISTHIAIDGEPKPGRLVDLVFKNPKLETIEKGQIPKLNYLSLDIETNESSREITAWALVSEDKKVVRIRHPKYHQSERSLLQELFSTIKEIDPDIITGWNILDFDLGRIFERAKALSLAFNIGRTESNDAFFMAEDGKSATALISGRQVVDALRLIRSGGESYENYKLETVAQAILGRGKTEANLSFDEHEKLRINEPERYMDYCLQDAQLVVDIMDKKKLVTLSQKRSVLTGLPLDSAWTTIASFEQLYARRIRPLGLIEPRFVPSRPTGSPGGTVLEPRPTLAKNVIVFDYRSLYPSVIRTFNIDPLARANAVSRPSGELISTLNGAQFAKERGILPLFVDECFADRLRAIESGDEVASHVLKILMNGFYGILGAPACRYAHKELASAVTSMGAYCLLFARDWFEEGGVKVLYGDTDSVFVESELGDDADFETCKNWAVSKTTELNKALSEKILAEYQLESFIELRFDKAYRRFLIPKLRDHGDDGSEERGRAKGYAGLKLLKAGLYDLDIKGMEAVRTDTTPLARHLQTDLLNLVFSDVKPEIALAHLKKTIDRLRRGELDSGLFYTKRLRRPPEQYLVNKPPHVKAALAAGLVGFRGAIKYAITKNGPELEGKLSSGFDYEHYIESQILPLSKSIGELFGFDPNDALHGSIQGELF